MNFEALDINTVRGILTAVIFAAFIGIWIWAWSKHSKSAFDASAALPLEQDKYIDDEQEGV
jgi:cytochrome c oxidase cbb3-type subunit 4